MKIKEIAFVCYAIEDIAKARHFYEDILGLTPGSKWEGEDSFFIEYEIGPHTLALGKGADNFKIGVGGATVALEVENFEEAIKKLKDNNVTFLLEGTETPVCHMALVKDPDGNQIMIHQRKG